MLMEDTQRLVTEIEMLKVVLYLVCCKDRERRKRKKKKRGSYPAKQRVFEALAAGEVAEHPAPTGLAASACCSSGIVTATVTTTPSNASAATIAIIAIEIVFSSSCDEPTICS
jgi:hypothetical protein